MIEGMIKILESAFEYPITISGNSFSKWKDQ